MKVKDQTQAVFGVVLETIAGTATPRPRRPSRDLRAHGRARPRARPHARDAHEAARGGRRALRARLRRVPLPESRRGHPADGRVALARARVRPRHARTASCPRRRRSPRSSRRAAPTSGERPRPGRMPIDLGRPPRPLPRGARPRVRGRCPARSPSAASAWPAAPRGRPRLRFPHDVAPRRLRPHAAGAAPRAGAREARGRRAREGAPPRRPSAGNNERDRVRRPPAHGAVGPDGRAGDRGAARSPSSARSSTSTSARSGSCRPASCRAPRPRT